MNVGDEKTQSLWMDTDVAADAKPLRSDQRADTVVIGSGIAGLSTAYELARAGHKVVVIDRGKIGRGMTARTTAHLTSPSDDGFVTLNRTRGKKLARYFYESHAAAIDRIEEIQAAEKIDCAFRRLDGFLFPALGKKPKDELAPEYEAGRKIGVKVEWHTGLPFNGLEETRCLRYLDQGAFHPLRYLRGLATAIEKRDGLLFADTRVDEVSEDLEGVVIRTEGGHTVRASWAVVATNSPINDVAAIHSKQAPYRTYAMALTIPKGNLKDALYWDTLDPYHYVRPQPGRGTFDYVIAGGADHKTGQADDGDIRFEAIEAWIRNLLPQLGNVTHRWSGQVLDPVDYSAFIGRNPGNENVFVATGDSGQGITHGVVASLLISELILQGQHRWSELYEPSRKTPGATHNFISENLTALKQFAEFLLPGDASSLDELKPGQGAVVRDGTKKIAAYRDPQGKLHLLSAACTHLGCHIRWNSLEACWDCPCHGSQFAPDGTVLNAPAVTPLSKID